jgi:hypothetical protein
VPSALRTERRSVVLQIPMTGFRSADPPAAKIVLGTWIATVLTL